MPITVSHAYSATTPENPANGEVGPNAWNNTHAVTLVALGSEISGAFSNDPAHNVSFTLNGGGRVVADAPAALSVTGANGSSVVPQTLAFSNANGLTLGVSTAAGGATVTGSYTVPTIPGATVFSNSNNVSFGLAGSTVTATATFSQSNQAFTGGVSGGNTAGNTGTVSNQIVLAGGNNITLSASTDGAGMSVTVSGANVPALSSVTVSDPAGSATLARIAFTNLNGVTLSLSTGAGGSHTIVGSHNAITTGRASNDAVGLNTAKTNVTWTVNSSGLSFDAGGYAGTGFTSTTTAGANLVGTHGTNGLSVAVPAWLTSQSNQAASAANGSFAFQTLSFSNLNGISFGTSAGSAITASHNAITTARASSDAVGLNTAKTNVTWTVNSSGLSFDAGGYAGTGFATTTVAGTAVAGTHASNGMTLAVPPFITTAATFSGGVSNVGNTSGNTGTVSNQLVLAGGNNITLSGSTNAGGMTLTISGANVGGAQTGISGIQVSDSTFTSGTVSFRNANGASFGSSGANGVSLSYTVPTLTSWTVSDAATSATVGRLAFTNSNGLTLSLSTSNNGNHTVIGSYTVPTITSLTVSDAATSGTLARIAFTNLNGVTLSLSTGAGGSHTIVGSHNALTSQSNQAFSAQGGSSAFQTLSFSNANGATFSNNAGQVQLSYTVPAATSWTVSDAATSATVGRLAFTNSNGLTLSLSTSNNGNHTVIGSYTVPSVTDFFSKTNTTFNGANVSGSLTLNTNGLQVSLSVQAPGGSSWTVSDAATSATVGRLAFTNSNGLTLSLSTSNNGNHTVIGSYTVPTLTSWTVSDAATSGTVGRLAFTNSNGLTLSLSTSNNGNHTVIGSYTVPTITSMTVSDAATSGTLARIAFTNLNGVTLSLSTGAGGSHTIVGSHNALTSQSNQNVTAGNGGFAFQTLSFSNVNGFSFGTSAGSAITGSYTVPTITSWTVSDAATSATVGRLAFTNSNGLTLSLSTSNNGNHTVIGSYTVPTVTQYFSNTATTFNGANISASITNNTNGLQLSFSVAAPGAAAEANAIALLGANTAGNTTATGSTIGWSGVNVTLSGTNNSQVVVSAPATSSLVGASNISISTNGSTITVGQVLQSYYENLPLWQGSTTMSGRQSTSMVVPFYVDNPLSFAILRLPVSMAAVAASSTAATTGNTQFSYGLTRSHNFVIYSRGIGANSMSLRSVASTQLTDQQSVNVSANANSTQFSYSNRASYQMSTGTVGVTADYSSSAASLNFNGSSNASGMSGNKFMDFRFATSLSAGQYWLAYGISSSSTSQFTNQGSRLFADISVYGASQPNVAFGTVGDTTNSSVAFQMGLGSFSTAGGGTTASLPISAISSYAAHMKPALQFINIA